MGAGKMQQFLNSAYSPIKWQQITGATKSTIATYKYIATLVTVPKVVLKKEIFLVIFFFSELLIATMYYYQGKLQGTNLGVFLNVFLQ